MTEAATNSVFPGKAAGTSAAGISARTGIRPVGQRCSFPVIAGVLDHRRRKPRRRWRFLFSDANTQARREDE